MNLPAKALRRRFPLRLGCVVATALACFGLLARARGDEQVRRVQEELRKRNLFFGEVDGRPTTEVREALKRYQQRKGFAPSGELGQETLAALGIAALARGSEDAVKWPEEPVLKSDSARELSEEERAQLERTAGELSPIAEAPPSSPADVPPPVEPPMALPPSARSVLPPAASGGTSPPPPEPASASPERLDAADVERFVRDYLAVCETNDLARELSFYATTVRYFDQGTVNLGFVERDVKRYYLRWPQRAYSLVSVKISPHPNQPHEFVARFRIRFTVANDRAHASGQTENVFGVRAEGGSLKFTSLHEVRVHG